MISRNDPGAVHAAGPNTADIYGPMLCEEANNDRLGGLRHAASIHVPGARALVTCEECIQWLRA